MLPGRREAVLDLLHEHAGVRPAIMAEEHLGHEWAPVTRLTLDRELPGIGVTVVVKTHRTDQDSGWGGPVHQRREHAGLLAVDGSGIAPGLIAADHTAGVLIATDLGTWPTLETVLLGDDRDAAVAAMIGLGRTVGRLHATTLHRETLHAETLTGLGSTDPRAERLGQWPGADRWADVETDAVALGFPDPCVARDDIALVLARLVEPGLYAALVHMDLHPANALVMPDGVKLLDFEGSFFGHIGWDAASLHYPFPTYSTHWATLPPEVVVETDRAYRSELPAQLADGIEEALAIGAAAALAVRVQRLTLLASDGQTRFDRWRRRAQLLQQIRVFEQLADRAGVVLTLAKWFSRLGDAMAERWPDATDPPPPTFPAFRCAAP